MARTLFGEITPEGFRSRFAEFKDSPDEVIEGILPVAIDMKPVSYESLIYLVAHLIAIAKEQKGTPDGGSGEVKEERVGESIMKFVPQTDVEGSKDTFFSRTPYGRVYLLLEERFHRRFVGRTYPK